MMRSLRRGRASLIGTGVALTLLCVAGTTTASGASLGAHSAKSAAKPHVTLSLLVSYSKGEVSLHKLYQKEFSAAHPGASLTFILPQTGSVLAKFETLVAGGTPPNVYIGLDEDVAVVMARGALAPVPYKALGVSGFAQLASQYVSRGLLNTYTRNGTLYGVPEQVSNYNAFVNKGLFTQAGLRVPTTWGQVCSDGRKLLKMKGGVPQQEELGLPTNFEGAEALVLNAIADEFGSPLFNATGTQSNLTKPAVVAAFKMLQDLVYKCHAFVPAMNGTTAAAERELYGEGRSAMVLDVGSWYTPVVQQQYPAVWRQTTVTPYPTEPGKAAVSPGYSYAYVVANNAPNQGLTWQYIAFLKNQGLNELKLSATYSGLKSVAASSVAKATPYWNSVWVPTLKSAIYIPPLVNATQIEHIVGTAYDSIMLDHANVSTTLAAANGQIQPLLNH